MNSNVTQDAEEPCAGTQNTDNTESAEHFQKFICELFEKNGILNDLRTYLRRHIVTVLKCAEAGNTPVCHQNFTQRLELTFQALNILIAEYLLTLEFSYTLSVFVSEIPLANMVFDYAKSLMGSDIQDVSEVKFTDNDVWSILNYLGVQCDSEHAFQILEMYRNNEQLSLLLCILKCIPMYQKGLVDAGQELSSVESLSSEKSSDTLLNKGKVPHRNPSRQEKCKHFSHCKACQSRMSKIKEKFKKKKKQFCKNINQEVKSIKLENIMKNIGVLERTLINEMFQEVKSVYEAEVEMVKVEEDKKVKRSMASHALQLQKEREELEESFKARKAELEHNVAEKKRFLWGLARALREQHKHMTRAMLEVQTETKRLTAKEDNLKARLAEAEQMIRKRAEEMRTQISEELATLERHLSSIKHERDSINKERSELETLKGIENNASKVIKVHDMENEEIQSQYDLIKNELVTLKKYLETSKLNPRSVTEKGTLTDLRNVSSNLNVSLNNSHNAEKFRSDAFDDRVKNQVVNDFKKKNVNFTPSKVDELYREQSYAHTRSSESSEMGDTAHPSQAHRSDDVEADTVHRLKEENNRLKECARQQQSHIEALSRAAARACTCAVLRPLAPDRSTVSTPTPCQPQYFLHSVNTCASANTVSMSWYKGAGEELSVFSDAQPRILVPGDSIPFVGVIRDRERHVGRRQLLSQWRALRSRTLPLARVTKRTPSPVQDRPGSSGKQTTLTLHLDNMQPGSTRDKTERHKSVTLDISRNREKSPKSVLREAKEKLRNIKELTVAARENNSNVILREAKLRLRKLEIEAEAVEKSYLDFRRRQSEFKAERNARALLKDDTLKSTVVDRNLDANGTRSQHKLENTSGNEVDVPLTDYQKAIRSDFDKYLREYQTSLSIGETHFKKHTAAEFSKPIPETYSFMPTDDNKGNTSNYLETPLTEFRKLYRSSRQVSGNEEKTEKIFKHVNPKTSGADQEPAECSSSRQHTPTHNQVQSILKKNKKDNELSIKEIENSTAQHITAANATSNPDEQNLLRVEVESVSGVRAASDELLVVVQNTIDIREVSIEQNSGSCRDKPNQMTIVVSPAESMNRGVEDIDVDVDLKRPEKPKKSLSPEQEARLTRNDVLDAIFNADPDYFKVKAVKEPTSKGSVSDCEKAGEVDDYSADVDNYISRFSSPMSVLKTSEDENLWDS
ncbi:unnamed protein product [Arctia plantaginis]|uniref:LisH domain-containing protein n=1 Tax=Arctia plantaginis TaxID=874455 RepID=A0A8S1AAP5_ARCPL|nr:unnamed protein product [Arctia plantaginis]